MLAQVMYHALMKYSGHYKQSSHCPFHVNIYTLKLYIYENILMRLYLQKGLRFEDLDETPKFMFIFIYDEPMISVLKSW